MAMLSRSKSTVTSLSPSRDLGASSGLDVAQQQALLSTTMTQLELLRRQRGPFEHAIATLTGTPAPSFRLAPDITALRRVEARGVIVIARAARSGFDFVSRFFAPNAGRSREGDDVIGGDYVETGQTDHDIRCADLGNTGGSRLSRRGMRY